MTTKPTSSLPAFSILSRNRLKNSEMEIESQDLSASFTAPRQDVLDTRISSQKNPLEEIFSMNASKNSPTHSYPPSAMNKSISDKKCSSPLNPLEGTTSQKELNRSQTTHSTAINLKARPTLLQNLSPIPNSSSMLNIPGHLLHPNHHESQTVNNPQQIAYPTKVPTDDITQVSPSPSKNLKDLGVCTDDLKGDKNSQKGSQQPKEIFDESEEYRNIFDDNRGNQNSNTIYYSFPHSSNTIYYSFPNPE